MILFFKRLMALARPYRLRLVLGVIFGFVTGFTSPMLMVAIKLVIDVVFPPSKGVAGTGQLHSLPAWVRSWVEPLTHWLHQGASAHTVIVGLVIGSIPLIMLARGLCAYLNTYCLQWVSIRVITDLRNQLFGHLTQLSLGFFHQAKTGELMSRITNDTGMVQASISNSLSVMIEAPVTILGLSGLLIYEQPKLTLLSLIVLPICLAPIILYARKARRSSAALQQYSAELSTVVHEAFTGARIVKAYNLEATVAQQFRTTAQKFIGHYMRLIRSMELPGPLIEFIGSVGVALIFLYIALESRTPMQAGDFFQFIGCIFLMYQPVKSLTRLYHQLEQARAASDRVFELLETQNQVREPEHPTPLQAASAPIRFEDIHFSYGDKVVLDSIRLTVDPGQVIALVGASGSGKTTLTNLLLRFYDPQKGAIRIGNTDIRQVTTRDLRSQIAVVTQETILFNDTIRNNIALGRPGAAEHEIIAAAKHAHAHDFILEKPQSYDTVIGEKGITLSGGQRQRLAIARALLKNAPILILDEATSALDTESERAVQAALDDLMIGRTTLCIAHRLSTVQHADLIVVLDQGRIVETGKHAELLQRGGIYQKLYDLQFQA